MGGQGLADCYNVDPDDDNCITTGELVDLFCLLWNEASALARQDKMSWINKSDGGLHEANFLKLDCTKLKQTFGWRPKWSIREALGRVVEFEQMRLLADRQNADMDSVFCACMHRQIEEYRKA